MSSCSTLITVLFQVGLSEVLKSIDRAIEVIHYDAGSRGGQYTHAQRENLRYRAILDKSFPSLPIFVGKNTLYLYHFYTPVWKTGHMGTPAARRRVASTGFPLSKSKSFHQVFIKLGEYVGVHNVSTKIYNQSNPPPDTPQLWPFNCPKIRVSN